MVVGMRIAHQRVAAAIGKETDLQFELVFRERLEIPGDVDERQRAVCLALDAHHLRFFLRECQKAAEVFFQSLSDRALRGLVEPLPDCERQTKGAVRGTAPNGSQFRKAHQQCANQTDGVRILNQRSRVHRRLFSWGPIPTRAGFAKGDGWVRRRPQVSPHRPLEMTDVTLRKVPGAVTLGLLASLAAHVGLYGGSHAMGGSYHDLLLQVALAGLLGLVAFFGALAWGAAGATTDGTVLAARLRDRLPDGRAVLLSAGLWFVTAESDEPGHAGAPLALCLGALIAVSYVVAWLARAITGAVARAVLAVTRTPFSPRTPSWQRRARMPVAPRRILLTHRRFARPPPIATFYSA